jgi:hypothetical protein
MYIYILVLYVYIILLLEDDNMYKIHRLLLVALQQEKWLMNADSYIYIYIYILYHI